MNVSFLNMNDECGCLLSFHAHFWYWPLLFHVRESWLLQRGVRRAYHRLFLSNSTPLASKVHCSINGLENSSSPQYSKVQHLFGIAVGLFSAGVGLFLAGVGLFPATVGLGKSPPPTKKSPPPIEKSPPLTQKSPTLTEKSNLKKVLLRPKKVLL